MKDLMEGLTAEVTEQPQGGSTVVAVESTTVLRQGDEPVPEGQ